MRVLSKLNLLNLGSTTADQRSEIVDVSGLFGFCVQATWTATTAAGTVKIEASIDGEAWDELATTQAINNDSGTALLNFDGAHYTKVRVFLDYTSGTITTFKAHISGKGE